MPYPWTRSFSAPSSFGLPKRGMILDMIHTSELNRIVAETFYLHHTPDSETKNKRLEELSNKLHRINKEKER